MRSAAEFIHLSGIANPKMFGNVDLHRFIEGVHEYASIIWESPIHVDYVDHGIDHSYRVLRKAISILDAVTRGLGREHALSDLERAVLTVAALIHDTGMQRDKYSTPKLGPELSRKEHVENGMNLLEAAMGGSVTSIPKLTTLLSYHSWLGHAGRIGFAHSGREKWEQLIDATEDDWGSDGQHLRFKMLAAALRLGDEVENGFQRIMEVNRLLGDGLDDDTLAHWMACYYIDDVRVASAATGLRIEVVPRIPKEANEEQEKTIITLLSHYRLRRMREECTRVLPFLAPPGISRPVAEVVMEPLRRQAILDVPERLVRIVQQQPANALTLTVVQVPSITVIGNVSEALKKACRQLKEAEAGEDLVIPRHAALRSGWHCSRYYLFPRLLGTGNFLDSLARGLADFYRGDSISCVIGIGTSGGQIASRLALALDARSAYTFSAGHDPAQPGLRSGNTTYERELSVEPYARVLIVDDIIGKGTSVSETIEMLRTLPNPPSIIRVFCILAAGDAAELANGDGPIPFNALATSAEVDYWEEAQDGFCEMCRDKGFAVIRER